MTILAFIILIVSSYSFANDCQSGDSDNCNIDLAQQAFDKCLVCHSLNEQQHGAAGPSLYRLGGRKAGTVEGFKFSKALRTSDVIWNEITLDAFLKDPQKSIPRNVMPFAGLKNEEERKALICFLLNEDNCKP
jgi:cytochrome c